MRGHSVPANVNGLYGTRVREMGRFSTRSGYARDQSAYVSF